MGRIRILLALTAAVLSGAAAAQGGDRERKDAPPIEPYKIILVGDSTMAPHSGWGAAFCADHVKSSVACLNLGRGGRSTRSYRQEGSWDIALAEAKVAGYRATYVLIQFAHNDQSDRPERWTERTAEFPANLRRYVDEVRAAGATPVLLTPLTRREFKDGRLQSSLESWSEEIRKVARAISVPLVDLNARSAEAVQTMGAAAATRLAQVPPLPAELAAAGEGTTLKPRPAPEPEAVPTTAAGPRGRVTRKFDYTHVGPEGAALFASIVTDELAKAVPSIASQLVP